MSSLIQIQIPKRSKVCGPCLEQLDAGMDYFSVLSENQKREYDRQDFCSVCFAKFVHTNNLALAKYWKSKVPLKKQTVVIPSTKNEQILNLLKSSLELHTPTDEMKSFVLALFLARKRFMSLRKEVKQEDGTTLQIYEILETEEMILVKKVAISTLQIEEIRAQIAKQLKSYGN